MQTKQFYYIRGPTIKRSLDGDLASRCLVGVDVGISVGHDVGLEGATEGLSVEDELEGVSQI